MISKATKEFWKEYGLLPEHIKASAIKAYDLFTENPAHPSLQFKKVNNDPEVYSVRITINYRALGAKQNDIIIWFWIGNHTSYERLISSL